MPLAVSTPVFPLSRRDTDGDGVYDVYYIDNIKDRTRIVDQNIKMVLLTNPGERFGDENFGVGLSRYLFEFEEQILSGADYTIVRSEDAAKNLFGDPSATEEERNLPPLRENIMAQFSTYLPYLVLKNVIINADSETNSLRILINYYLDEDVQNATFDYTLIPT